MYIYNRLDHYVYNVFDVFSYRATNIVWVNVYTITSLVKFIVQYRVWRRIIVFSERSC